MGVGLVVLSLVGGGCSSPPPPPPPPQPAPEPPPPKCNTLKDACTAAADTRLLVPDGVEYGFVPPKGWVYAKLPDSAVAQVDGNGAVMVASSFKRPTHARTARRVKEVKSATELVGVVPNNVEGALTLKNPRPDEYNGLPVSLWEVPSAKRGDNEGALVVLSADVGDRELLIVGFAPADDSDGTKAIMKALTTLSPKANGGNTKSVADDSEGPST